MFDINVFDGKEPLNLYLSTPDKKIITCINEGIDVASSNLSVSLNQQYELTFTYNSKIIDLETGELIDSPGYDYIVEGMYLILEKIGLFKMESPIINSDGDLESKEVTAKSCDSELEDKIFSSQINVGERTSREFLVEYDANETEMLVNEYTGIPFDWIVLYNTFPEQLQVLLADYNKGTYGTPNTDIKLTNSTKINNLYKILKLIPRLVTKIITKADGSLERTDYIIYTYNDNDEISSLSIDQNFGTRIQELITFYTKYRDQLSLLSIALEKMEGNWSVGEVYGYSEGDYSLCNRKCSFDSNESIYTFLTQTLAQSIECVVSFDIVNRKVNVTPADKIGNDTGIMLSYETLVNSVNISCDESQLCTRLYVTGADDLGIEMVNYGEDYIDDLTYKISARDSQGNRIYVSDALAEKYLQYKAYRDNQRDNWITYTKEYNQCVEDISEIQNRVPLDDLKNEWGNYSQELLKQTQNTYNNLLAALETLYKNDYGSVGLNSDGSINENYIKTTEYWYDYKAYQDILLQLEAAIATWPSYSDDSKWTTAQRDKYLDKITAYETEWSLYGTDELIAKIETYNNNVKVMLDKETVCRISPSSERIKAWAELTDAEKSKYGSVERTYADAYELYNENLTNRNSAQNYLDTVLKPQVSALEKKRDTAAAQRTAIKKSVSYEDYFTVDERKTLCLLFKDAQYTNENILTTSIDTSVSMIDVQYDLLKDSQEKLEIYSRPQLTFETEINNLLGLPEFKALWKDFQLGNYIYIEFRDNTYMKTRLINYQLNPFDPDINELSIGFSSFIISKSKRWDTPNLLNLSVADGISNYSSSGGNGYGGFSSEYLSDIMLGKLLNSETFGSKITNVILDTMKLNVLTAQKGVFNSLYGDEFNFAGGSLVYKDKVLYIDGKITWNNIVGGSDYVDNTIQSEMQEFIQGDFADALKDIKAQDDKKAETWYQATDPSANWKTDSEKAVHKGDLWYNTSDENTYIYNGSTWDMTKSSIPQVMFDAFDGKAQVFAEQPTPPYSYGDLWVQGETGDILTCINPKEQGETFSASDWAKASKYTDDSALESFIENEFTTSINEIKAQADKKAETWYQATDPSADWTTTEEKREHIGDMWFNSSSNIQKTYLWNGSSWDEMSIPKEIFDTIDGKAQIFVEQPIPPYNIGDLWVQGETGDILRCKISRAVGESYNSSDWTKASKYTDDSSLESFISNTYSIDLQGVQEQIDGKAETWYQASDPSSSWTTTDTKAAHKGDLWYNTSATSRQTYRWNGSAWMEMDVPVEVFDKIDGKAAIFVTTPTPPYNVGDLWVQGSSGDILKCQTAKSEGKTFSSGDWVLASKYTDDSALKEFKNIIQFRESTEITGQYVFSPHILGGDIMIGDSNGIHAQILSNGQLNATGANISGAITATSLALGSNVTIAAAKVSGLKPVATSGSYNDLTNKPTIPNLQGYIYVNGTIGGTPAEGATGFVVSSAGLLEASNAVIYGTVYASKGKIGGLTLAGNSLYTNNKTSYNTAVDGVHVGPDGIGCGNGSFTVDSSGNLSGNKVKLVGGTVGGWTITENLIYQRENLTVDNTKYVYDVFLQSVTDGSANHLAIRRYLASQSAPSDYTGWEYLAYLNKQGNFKCQQLRARKSFQCGTIGITPSAANTPTSIAVEFSESMWTKPIVVVSARTSFPGTNVTGVGTLNETTEGFTLYLTRTNTTTTYVSWIAMSD